MDQVKINRSESIEDKVIENLLIQHSSLSTGNFIEIKGYLKLTKLILALSKKLYRNREQVISCNNCDRSKNSTDDLQNLKIQENNERETVAFDMYELVRKHNLVNYPERITMIKVDIWGGMSSQGHACGCTQVNLHYDGKL